MNPASAGFFLMFAQKYRPVKKYTKSRLAIFFLIAMILSSCEIKNVPTSVDPYTISGEAQGSTYTIKYFGDSLVSKNEIDSILQAIDQSMSTWVASSRISQFNASKNGAEVDQMFMQNLMSAYLVSRASQGAFNPLIKPLVNYWGFGENERKLTTVDSAEVQALLKLLDLESLEVVNEQDTFSLSDHMLSSRIPDAYFLLKADSAVMLDFNAIAQGYSVDVLGSFLKRRGVQSALIELGGEMLATGKKADGTSWKVGVDKPKTEGARELNATIELENKAIATSGNYRKFYEINGVKYHHTIDSRTGYPARHTLLSATVVASDCASADAFATTCMVVGLEDAIDLIEKNDDLDAYFIYSGKEGELLTWSSAWFEGKLKELD